MSNAMPSTRASPALLAELRARWAWFVALGAIMLTLGAAAFARLFEAMQASILSIGALMLAAAIAQLIHGIAARRWCGLFWFVSGLLYGAAGFLAYFDPLLAARAVTWVLAASMIFSGVARIIGGSRSLRPAGGWGWVVASGAISVAAGVAIALRWPAATAWSLGLVLAIDLAFQGAALEGFGFALRPKGNAAMNGSTSS